MLLRGDAVLTVALDIKKIASFEQSRTSLSALIIRCTREMGRTDTPGTDKALLLTAADRFAVPTAGVSAAVLIVEVVGRCQKIKVGQVGKRVFCERLQLFR